MRGLMCGSMLCAALALTACAAPQRPLHGMQLSPPQPAAGFTLRDQNGKAFSLAQTRGQAILLYFGFTHCQDVCPQTLALLGKARDVAKLTPQQVRIVMVSVDPDHDSPAALHAFFRKVGVQATGLTGSRAMLDPVYRSYGIAVQPRRSDILHTDTIFLIDPHGRIRETLVPQSPPKDIAADLRSVVE
jgi:protein SCO1/2